MIVINEAQLGQFLEELRQKDIWPQSLPIYKHAENHFRRGQFMWPGMRFVVDKFPNFGACILGPDPDHPNPIPRRDYLTYNAVARDLVAFRQLLLTPGVIEWTNACYFSGFPIELHDTLKDVCEQHGTIIGPNDRIDFAHVGILINATDVNPGSPVLDGLILRPFTADDIPQVNKLWNFGGTPSTEVYLSYLQSHGFPNMAAFTAMTGEMVGFLLCNADMNLAAANVTPAYRGRQLFQAMAAEWCKAMAVVGHGETFAFVDEWNEASKRSLMRLGGKRVENWNVAYLLFTPKNCDPNDPLLLWYNVINGKIKSLPKTG